MKNNIRYADYHLSIHPDSARDQLDDWEAVRTVTTDKALEYQCFTDIPLTYWNIIQPVAG
ncbi:hypothetical protein GLW04_15090 [Halobacillus litoralis]|uniref:Uncharacterized protein n=1 Tax=Halobacillus litoralis TaxID=45668 RepID=A0A845DXN6_9BACI|nr:hypothetical protein [Halobacillus litoralis]MYL21225.1 hypothetical protein [Halobacillus litoralis]